MDRMKRRAVYFPDAIWEAARDRINDEQRSAAAVIRTVLHRAFFGGKKGARK